MGHLSLGCRPTPSCLYRIAETRLSVASDGCEKLRNYIGGSVDGSWRAKTLADFGEARAEILAGAGVVKEAEDLLGDFGRREVLLNQLGNDAALGDEVDHTEIRRAHERFGEQCCERGHAIDDH